MAVKKVHLNIPISPDLRDRLAFAALSLRIGRGDLVRTAVSLICTMASMPEGERIDFPLAAGYKFSVTRLVPQKGRKEKSD